MTDQFESMVDDQMPVTGKMKNYTAGNKQSRWASVLTGFFESVGIETRRDASTASNIDAVENLSKYPERFLEILQRVVSQPFTFGDQPAAESNSQFGDLLQEMLPIRDEDRADLKQMLGRSMPDHELEMIISNGGQLVQMIQQNFPELNIQLEGVYDRMKDRVKNSSVVRGTSNIARGANALIRGRMGLGDDGYEKSREAGIEGLKSAGRGSAKLAKGTGKLLAKGAGKLATKGAKALGTGIGNLGSALSQSGTFKDTHSTSGEGLKYFLPQPGMFDTGPDSPRSSDDSKPNNDKPESTEESKPDFAQLWKKHGASGTPVEEHDVLNFLQQHFGLSPQQAQMYINNIDLNSGGWIDQVHARLKKDQLSENLNMKRTFNDIVQHAGEQLFEAPEDEMAVDPAADATAAPPAAPPAPEPEPVAETIPDDMDKLQADMLELVRRALIINPKDIDQESYMQLTTRVNFDNMQQVKPLLLKLVQNHYPDLDMGDIPKGPGT